MFKLSSIIEELRYRFGRGIHWELEDLEHDKMIDLESLKKWNNGDFFNMMNREDCYVLSCKLCDVFYKKKITKAKVNRTGVYKVAGVKIEGWYED